MTEVYFEVTDLKKSQKGEVHDQCKDDFEYRAQRKRLKIKVVSLTASSEDQDGEALAPVLGKWQ